MNEEAYKSLFAELTKYEDSGVAIALNDFPASPMQIVNAYLLREDSTYMRDYTWDEDGKVKKLTFHDIRKD